MIRDRSLRTRIRCTPVCGPAPVLYCVSGLPFGCSIRNEILVAIPGLIVPVGWKAASWKMRAAPIFGAFTPVPDEDEPQPAATSAAMRRIPAAGLRASATPGTLRKRIAAEAPGGKA